MPTFSILNELENHLATLPVSDRLSLKLKLLSAANGLHAAQTATGNYISKVYSEVMLIYKSVNESDLDIYSREDIQQIESSIRLLISRFGLVPGR